MQSTLLMLTLALVIGTVPVLALNAGADLEIATLLIDAGADNENRSGAGITPVICS